MRRTEVRTWKDADSQNRASGHPAGLVELSEDDMLDVAGGSTWGCVIGTVGISIAICSPNGTLCGSCQMGTRGCC